MLVARHQRSSEVAFFADDMQRAAQHVAKSVNPSVVPIGKLCGTLNRLLFWNHHSRSKRVAARAVQL